MNRKLLTLGLLLVFGAGCTLPTEEDLTDMALEKLNIDKDTALAYSEIAMKQAAMAASAMTSDAPKASAPAGSPQFSRLHKGAYQKFSVTADTCVVYSEEQCTADGLKCSYTEDYKGCGVDFAGKIIRTFEGNFETYKVTVEFLGYSEKVSTDAAHYAFTGKSIMTGTIGVSSANLSLHAEGTSGSNIGGRIVSIKTSSDMTFLFLNNALTLNGTQVGTIVETNQTGSMSITELKYEESCEKGPSGGTVTTTLDGKPSITVITGCGVGTMTVDGEAQEIGADEINATFSPGNGSKDESGFDGIIEGTDGGSLLSGDWFFDSTSKFAYLSIYEYDGITSIFYGVNTDVNSDNDFFGNGDTFLNGFGTLTVAPDSATAAFELFESGSWNSEFMPVYSAQGAATKTYAYSLNGNGSLVFDNITFTKYGDYREQPVQDGTYVPPTTTPTNPFDGSWLNYSYDATTFADTAYHSLYVGGTFINSYECYDDDVDGFLYSFNDTCVYVDGSIPAALDPMVPSGSFTPTWTYMEVDTYASPGSFTTSPGSPPTGTLTNYSLDEMADGDPMNDTLTIDSKVFTRSF